MLQKYSVHKLRLPECILVLLSAHWRCLAARCQCLNIIHFQQWHSGRVIVARNVNISNWAKCQRKEKLTQREGNLIRDWKASWYQNQNLPEELSHWTHAENYVQVVPDSLCQVAEQGVRSLHHIVFPGRLWQSIAYLEVDQEHVMRHVPLNTFLI